MNQQLYRLSFLIVLLFITNITYAQDYDMTISIVGSFNDENNDGLAQTGETILFTCTVENTGTQALDSIKVSNSNSIFSSNPIFVFNGKGPIYNLQPGQFDNTTYSCAYTLGIQDLLIGSVNSTASATGFYVEIGSPGFIRSIHTHGSGSVSFNSQPMAMSNPMIETEKGDVYIHESENGVILKSPGGNCFRIRVEDNGTLRSVPITCP